MAAPLFRSDAELDRDAEIAIQVIMRKQNDGLGKVT